MDTIEALRHVPLFRGLSDSHYALLAGICANQVVSASALICRQGDLGKAFLIIQSGEAVVYRIDEAGFQRAAGTLRNGSSYGAASLFLGEPYDATLRASTEVSLARIRQEDLQDLLAEHPSLWHELALPDDVRQKLRTPFFSWLDSGENVVIFCRRHAITVAPPLLGASLAFLAYLLIATLTGLLNASAHRGLAILVPGAIYLLIMLWFWVDWRNDHLVVTNRRVAHQEKVALVFESRDEAPLDRIQSINVQYRLLGKLLGYGDLEIETAADIGRILFHSVPSPETIREAIFAEVSRALATRHAVEYHSIQRELTKRLEQGDEPLVEAASEGQASGPNLQAPAASTGTVVWRKHWWFLLCKAWLPALLSLGLLALTAFSVSQPAPPAPQWPAWFPYVTLGLLVPVAAWLWWTVSDWANDLYVITDDRIVDLERKPLSAHESRREASLGVIQNVSLRIPHILAGLLGFGDVTIQTAGRGDFTFERVSAPRRVQAEIFRRIAGHREAQRQRELSHQRTEVAEWFEAYEDLRRSKASPSPAADPPDGTPPNES